MAIPINEVFDILPLSGILMIKKLKKLDKIIIYTVYILYM
jgi:hypothetical protein